MSALSIQVPFPVFQDRDGQPLESGYVWIGEPNLNPQTNPVVAYFDSALNTPAPQPLRTLNGYISNAGTPAQVYVDGVNFSILVQDSKGTTVYNFPDGTGISPDACGVTYNPPLTGAVPYPVCEKLEQTVSVKDFDAAGDGVTDDTAAIQAAFTNGAGGSIYIPSGNYKITSRLNISSNTYVHGDGATSRIFGNGTIELLRGETAGHDITLDSICLDGQKFSGTADIVVCYYQDSDYLTPNNEVLNITIKNCVMKNASAGIGIANGKYINVYGNTISAMYRHTSGAYAGVYGYGVVLNGCEKSAVEQNFIGLSGGLIQRHGIYLPPLRDNETNPTQVRFSNQIRIVANTIHMQTDFATEPFSSCVEAWNYFYFLIADNIFIEGVRGINAAPEYQNGSRVVVANNIFSGQHVCIRNGPESFGRATYFEEYNITGNLLMPLTSVAHQCVKLQGVKNIVFTDNYCRGDGSSTFAFGYRDSEAVPANIVADSILVGNNRIKGFTQGYSVYYTQSFVDTGTVFSDFTTPSAPAPYSYSNVTYAETHPNFAPYVELFQYSGLDWQGVHYYSVTLQKEINYNGSEWVDESANKIYGTTAQRPERVPYGFTYYDTNVGSTIYYNGFCYYTTRQPAPPFAGTTTELNTFKTNYPNALLAYGIPSWNTTTSKPVFWNFLTLSWFYADGSAM